MTVSGLLRGALAAVLVVAVLVGAAVAACGGNSRSSSSPALTITEQYATVSNNDVSALYFTIRNDGGADDGLVAVSTNASPTAMIHQDVVQGSSASMKQLANLPIPAHGAVTLQPGKFHVMIMDLPQPLLDGTTIPVTLEFQRSGAITLQAPVKPIQ